MKKQQKELLKIKIEALEEETKKQLKKLSPLHEEAKQQENKNNELLKIEEAKSVAMFEGYTLKSRIEWKKTNANEWAKIQEATQTIKEALRINNKIKNIIDDKIYNIYNVYALGVYNLIIENIKNTRDLNDFKKFFDYQYNNGYQYNNICTFYLGDTSFNFNFNITSGLKPFERDKEKIRIYSYMLGYDSSYCHTILKEENLLNEERKQEELEKIKIEIKKLNNNIDDMIYNYYDIKNYIINIEAIQKEYQIKINNLIEKKNNAIEEADILSVKNIILI